MMTKMTDKIADKRIGNFNPSDDEKVRKIKSAARKFVSLIDDLCPDGRRKSKAMTDIETAQMYAVKSLFAPED